MKRIFSLTDCEHADSSLLGGKGAWLARLYNDGVSLPMTLCLTTEAYLDFMKTDGLREKISLELNRKEFSEMRWEEIWDASLRIRNLFLKTPFPGEFYEELKEAIAENFGDALLAIRSSAPDEDQQHSSFAGLHDSFVGISGLDNVVHSIKKVWSSLWSDRALLYRRELALSVEQSSMAVVIQQLVEGEVSGVCFTRDPLNQEHMTIEAVYGLNQGLVDGDVSPDRWSLQADGDTVIEHAAPSARVHRSIAVSNSVRLQDLDEQQKNSPPLHTGQVIECGREMAKLHTLYSEVCGGPLDIEWTLATSSEYAGLDGKKLEKHMQPAGLAGSLPNSLYILQVRPVTALQRGEKKDERSWYLSLHRSFTNLETLRETIEKQMLPEMAGEAEEFARFDLAGLEDNELALEIRKRQERSSYWTERYWRDCIPFAHGIRLFGEIYNDIMMPEDSHEFVQLLRGEDMLSLRRNKLISEIAKSIAADEKLKKQVELQGIGDIVNEPMRSKVAELISQFGSYFSAHADSQSDGEKMLTKIVLEYAKLSAHYGSGEDDHRQVLEKEFLNRLDGSGAGLDGHQLLDLARASYRIRDDDNIYLGRIEEQALYAVQEGKKRLRIRGFNVGKSTNPEEVAKLLEGKTFQDNERGKPAPQTKSISHSQHKARQLLGQPASRGVAQGRARVIKKPEEISAFQVGEILVVDSIDPAMTFFAPLAAAIVEQRGGMLIHGAIIAREYGIPCITGIVGATDYISTDDFITVDGYLGIVTVK